MAVCCFGNCKIDLKETKGRNLDEPCTSPDEAKPPKARPIRLDQLLKFSGIAQTGGHAKRLIQDGQVQVNGQIETRRRRQLSPNDVITIDDLELLVADSMGRP